MTTDPLKKPASNSDASAANSESDLHSSAATARERELTAESANSDDDEEAQQDPAELSPTDLVKGLAAIAFELRVVEIARSRDLLEAFREKELTARKTIEKQAEIRAQQIALQRLQIQGTTTLRTVALIAMVIAVIALFLIGALTGSLEKVIETLKLIFTPLAFIGSGAAFVLWRQRGSKEPTE